MRLLILQVQLIQAQFSIPYISSNDMITNLVLSRSLRNFTLENFNRKYSRAVEIIVKENMHKRQKNYLGKTQTSEKPNNLVLGEICSNQ